MSQNKRMLNRQLRALLSIPLMILLLFILVQTGFAQVKTNSSETDTQTQEVTIEQRIAELEAKLQSVKEQVDKAKQPEAGSVRLQFGISEDELQKHEQLLEDTEAVIQQQITALRKHASLQQLQKRRKNVLASPEDLAIPLLPPYSLSILDKYLNKQEDQKRFEETAELADEVAQKDLKDAQLNYGQAEQNLRQTREKADKKAAKKEQTAHEFKKIVATLEFDLAKAVLKLNNIYVQNAETEENLAR